jgi:hypothetical protein
MNIVWQNENGEIKVTSMIQPVADLAAYAVDCKLQDPNLVGYEVVAFNQDVPETKAFRGAWVYDDGIFVDMDKAREIAKDFIREKRIPLLAKLDVDYMRSIESKQGLVAESIIAKKQALRDATKHPDILNAQNETDLISYINKLDGN